MSQESSAHERGGRMADPIAAASVAGRPPRVTIDRARAPVRDDDPRLRPRRTRATMAPSMDAQPGRADEHPAHRTHAAHDHVHDRWCGHASLRHDDHLDYLHDGHLHHPDGDHVDDRVIHEVPVHVAHACHMHVHGPGCGHASAAHAGHTDYRHGQHLHAAHGDHYDEH